MNLVTGRHAGRWGTLGDPSYMCYKCWHFELIKYALVPLVVYWWYIFTQTYVSAYNTNICICIHMYLFRVSFIAETMWDSVEERLRRRLSLWKREYFSKGGRLTLI